MDSGFMRNRGVMTGVLKIIYSFFPAFPAFFLFEIWLVLFWFLFWCLWISPLLFLRVGKMNYNTTSSAGDISAE